MNLIIGTYTLPILREGFSWNENCGENGSHATSIVSLSVRPVDGFLTYLMTAEGNLSAKIKDGSTVLFSGVVRPYTGTSFEGNYQDNISLEIMDNTETLHQYIYPETTDGQKTGCIYPQVWQNKTLSEMVGILFGLGGQSISSSFASTESIPYFKLEGEQYLDDVISELLFEYGLDYKWNAEGKAVIFPTFVDSATVGAISDVRGNFSISRSDDTTDGLKVTWREYDYQTNVPLYSFDSGNQTFNEGWESQVTSLKQLTGKLYSGAMHDSHFNSGATMPSGNLWAWNFPDLSRSGKFWELIGKAKTDKAENTDSVLFVETDSSQISVSLRDEDGITLSTTLESYDVNGMRMYVDYSGIFNVTFGKGWTWKVNVRGNIGTAVESEASYNIIGANPDTKELKYRLGLKGSSVISESLVKQFYLRSKYSKISYSFSSLTSYDLGGFYTLEGNTIRLVSKVKDEDGIYTYRGEGAKAYSGVSLNVFSEQKGTNRSSSAKSAYDIAVDNGYTGSEEEWLASLDGVSTALLYLYKRSGVQPDSFDGGTVTYTFSTGAMSGSFGTWSTSIPTGTDALYFVLVRATGKGETYTVTSGMWSTPALMSESGSKGADGKTAVIVNIYQRATTSPATPTSDVTYSFADFTATGLGNWSLAIPAGTNPLWVSQACAISSGESDVIGSGEWATPRKVMENGESPVQIGLSSDSWVFPADCDGLVSEEEYANLKIDVTVVKGSSAVNFTLSCELTGITNVSVSGSSIVGSASSVMVGDSASVKILVTVSGTTYTKIVSIAKAKQSKATVLYFRWSKSETEFLPKDANSNLWIMGTSLIYYNESVIGNIPISTAWLSNWSEIEALKDDEYCYLWCKTSEDGTPFLFTGATGKTGEYRKVMYALSDSKITAPTDGWTETMPDIVNSTQYLWYKEKIVPAGGSESDVEWSTPIVSAVGIAVTESKISLSADGSKFVVGKQTILLDAPNVISPGTVTANEVNVADIMAQNLTLNNGGIIKSAGYSKGDWQEENVQSGFYMDSDGYLESTQGIFKEAIVEGTLRNGTIDSDSLTTVNGQSSTKYFKAVTTGNTKYFKKSELVSAMTTENSEVEINGTYGGNTVSKYINITDSELVNSWGALYLAKSTSDTVELYEEKFGTINTAYYKTVVDSTATYGSSVKYSSRTYTNEKSFSQDITLRYAITGAGDNSNIILRTNCYVKLVKGSTTLLNKETKYSETGTLTFVLEAGESVTLTVSEGSADFQHGYIVYGSIATLEVVPDTYPAMGACLYYGDKWNAVPESEYLSTEISLLGITNKYITWEDNIYEYSSSSTAESPTSMGNYSGLATTSTASLGTTTIVPYIISWGTVGVTILSKEGLSMQFLKGEYTEFFSLDISIEQSLTQMQCANIVPKGDTNTVGTAEKPWSAVYAKAFFNENGGGDIGSDKKPYDSVYASNFYGTLTGDVTGTLTGNVNSESTRNNYQVWGAVFN